MIVLHLGLEGCSQPRELWFVDMYIANVNILYTHELTLRMCNGKVHRKLHVRQNAVSK